MENKYITNSECVFVAFVIQHATQVRHIDSSGCLVVPYFLVKLELSRQILNKIVDIKFRENLFSGSRHVT